VSVNRFAYLDNQTKWNNCRSGWKLGGYKSPEWHHFGLDLYIFD